MNLSYISIVNAEEAPEGVIENIKEKYWVTHVSNGVVFVDNIPQCENTEEKAEKLLNKFDRKYYFIKFMPFVFRKI